ncbi:uncharacterized protein [Dendropsophus ebraccatus]|uniref:uncharacterized protein isoform X2 n=1 Tax=Dendropsophus ebraccatus TaxID=150705 RepID=UPI0038314DF1
MTMRYLAITSMLVAHCLCCIPCDKRGKEAMDEFTILIQNQQLQETLKGNATIKQLANAAQTQLMEYLEEEVQIMDKFAIADIVSEYKQTVKIIRETGFKGVQLLHKIQFQFQILHERIKEIVEEAERSLIVQTYTRCDTCEEEKVTCAEGYPIKEEGSGELSGVTENDPLPTLLDDLELPVTVSKLPAPEVTHHYHHNNKVFLAVCGAVAITMIMISAVICFIMWWWKNKKPALPQGEDMV